MLVFPFLYIYAYYMADAELVKTLDYILNRCDAKAIEAVAQAVVRRRKDLAFFGSMPVAPDAGSLARELSGQLNIEGNIESLKKSVRDYAIRIIRQQAPELTDAQIDELTGAWIPEANPASSKGASAKSSKGKLPKNVLGSMIDQFVSFSTNKMEEEEDMALRNEMGPWPDKYWKSFPQVIRLLIKDYINGEISEADFNTRIGLALSMQ